ncbi:MAG: extracellular solute-binding protein family 5 [Clostridia bacterium]|jgi:peptide/nickel transport system substrate-binding protein|nr:extracellular solute-binding protein family 5 [Clostridia bacterium]
MRINKRLSGYILFILICSILLVSCDEIENISQPEVKIEQEKASAGGALAIGSVEPRELNPLRVNSMSFLDVSKLLFEPLAEYDNSLKLVPVIAQSWQFENGSAQAIITLKNNIFWSDGERITSDDVVFSLDTIKNAQSSAFKEKLLHIYNYQAMGENTVKITFDQAFGEAFDFLTMPIIPEHLFRNNEQAVPVTSGPYKIASYTKLKQLELVPNDKWIRLGSVKEKGTNPYIEKINIQFINDMDAFSTAFQAKELDVLHTQSYDWEKYSEMKDVKTYKYTSQYYDFIGFNFNNSIFQDKAVRRAAMAAINRRGIIDKYLLGNAVLTDAPVNPNSWLYDGKDVIGAPRPVDARNLLKEAGFEDTNNDKVLERKFDDKTQTLRFTLITNSENEFRQKAAQEIKKNLEDVGFAVEIQIMSFEEMKTAIDTKKFDAVLTGYNLSPSQDLSFAFHSSQIVGGKNFMSYSNLNMDNWLYQAYTSTNEDIRKEMFGRIQQTFRDEVPCISLFFRESAIVVRDKVKGEISPDTINPYRNIQNWFIAKDRR